jgi:hypothetical protein
MATRKGEMSKSAVDSGWSHQVALPSPQVVAEFNVIMEFCKGLSLCPRGHWFRRDGRDYVVKCFKEKEHADRFAARFGGECMTPAERPPWIEKRGSTRR